MGENIFGDQSLSHEGYSYVSVSPSLLSMDNAVVRNGLLATDGPGFSAFIVDNSTNITAEALERFTEYAKDDFPILFVGSLPHASPYYAEDDSRIQAGMNKLLEYRTVKHISEESKAVSTLQSMGVAPAVLNLSPCPILYVHRVDQDNDVDYFWVYNSDIYTAHATEASFTAKGMPYILNSWTGSITPIVNYTAHGDQTKLWIDLKSNASTIVAFAPKSFFGGVKPPSVHVVSTDVEDLEYSAKHNTIVAKTTVEGGHDLKLSNGKTRHWTVKGIPKAKTLTPWRLTVQDWLPNPDKWNNYTSVYAYHNVTLDTLIPWPNITGLEHTSGVGTYSTQFHWDARSTVKGAYLDLGSVFMTARVWINDRWTGPVDVDNPVIDIGSYLVHGTNSVRIEVSTTMRNRLLQVNVTQSWEESQYAASYGTQPYGLTEPVILRPYAQTEIPLGY